MSGPVGTGMEAESVRVWDWLCAQRCVWIPEGQGGACVSSGGHLVNV